MTQNPDMGAGTPISLAGLRAGADVGGYRLLRRLGAGGMGVVWEVVDGDGGHVAMKILHPQIAADPMARRRLDREASVLARVRDSRVARILDIETGDGADGSGVTFVITELVDGPTLQHEVDHEGAYDLSTDARDLADLAHGLADSLSAVHAAGVIHRDLKPSNVMLGAQGPVLIDFGIAQVADDVRLTQTGQVTGTPGFIPPEMLDGDEPSPGVDWYACAGVLLFAVTGRAPFGSGPWQAVFRRVYAGTPELGALEEECPALARAFVRALAPRATDRLPHEDLLAVLDDVADGGTGREPLERALKAMGVGGAPGGAASEADTATGTFGGGYGVVGTQAGASGNGARTPAAGSAHSGGIPSAASGSVPGSYGYLTPPGTATGPSGAGADAAPASAPRPRRPAEERPQAPMASPAGIPASYAPGSGGYPVRPDLAHPPSAPQPSAPVSTPTPAPVPAPRAAPVPTPAPRATATPWMSTGPSPTTEQDAVAPEWAYEPRRHPLVILVIYALLVSLAGLAPVWVLVIFGLLVVVAGVVGRADDALRWRRLKAGRVSRGDRSRMWAGTPWYLMRSLVAAIFAALPAGVVAAIGLIAGSGMLGLNGDEEATVLAGWPMYHRMGMLFYVLVALVLFIVWMAPWGTPTRRGGARMVEFVMGRGSGPVIGGAIVLAVALGMFLLHAMAVLPLTLAPYGGGAS